MPNSNVKREPLLFGVMLANYDAVMEPTERRFEEILRTVPTSGDSRIAVGFSALAELKHRLQKQYEAAYPGLTDMISHVIDQEEVNALNVSSLFPQLVLPGLVEIHMRRVGLELSWKTARL